MISFGATLTTFREVRAAPHPERGQYTDKLCADTRSHSKSSATTLQTLRQKFKCVWAYILEAKYHPNHKFVALAATTINTSRKDQNVTAIWSGQAGFFLRVKFREFTCSITQMKEAVRTQNVCCVLYHSDAHSSYSICCSVSTSPSGSSCPEYA